MEKKLLILLPLLCIFFMGGFAQTRADKSPIDVPTTVLDERIPAPNLVFKNNKKKKVKLSSFKGKVVYIDIWASWCSPCMSNMPSLHILEDELKGKDVVFLTVGTDKSMKKWKRVVRRKRIKGTNVWAGDKHKMIRKLAVIEIPRYILIDKQGRIYKEHAARPAYVKADILKLLAE